ncbi:TPA: hypothetical protein ACRW8H_002126 [Enterococcus faecalis]|jgi:hypothetical protein|uniref:hypothetical protein n=1 Tax=Enterococcus TaxID=1350 RepID=UPI0001E198DC|nr:hypothetical protein [Enterococcus faecalis]EFM81040.1 hypothetical protein HMPREF9514_00055 [Enterococcus faecalis TX0855]EGO8064456.1 hypothetical protein [Enterococcus faecalis]EGO8298506.1 hypothetical protein [Enterococcus faecalis]EGO8589449.1 hypothetical protein [Enterococcus faecalis]EHE8516612.1 hypothetical protein [Enterococcus faecalis]
MVVEDSFKSFDKVSFDLSNQSDATSYFVTILIPEGYLNEFVSVYSENNPLKEHFGVVGETQLKTKESGGQHTPHRNILP